ncbi:MAG: bifunctional DNA primase/polymerase [Pseudolabrys sp.]
MLRTALTLAKKGQAVFPCRARDKRPATANGVKDATKDVETIRQWWKQDPQFNIAIATGAISEVFVVDIDGVDAEAALRKLETEHGTMPATVESITARGRHLFFRMPEVPVRNSTSKIALGIDVRGDGGYVLVPPSVHPTGRVYSWSVDSAGALADAPQWLLDRICERTNGNGNAPTPPSEWRTLVASGVDEGQRDNAVARLAGYFLRRYLDPLVVLEILRLWNEERCRPPLPTDDIERIVNSVAKKEMQRRSHGSR